MSNFIYSAGSGANDPMFGKFEHPIKMLIEDESNQCEKNKAALDLLFNIEKSNRYAETVMGESGFGTFQAKGEGQGAENDSVEKTFDKTIEHIEFAKEFTITRKMYDDAKFGMGTNMKKKPRAFVQAYYRTRNELGCQALIHGTASSMVYNKGKVDLTVGDGLSLFNSGHKYFTDKMKGKTQSNFFWGDLTSDGEALEIGLMKGANIIRNFKTETGETMGYTADTIIVPCNRPVLEMMVKKMVGSERTTGTNYNDINTQYGNWTIVVLDGWETTDDRFMLMSSAANRELSANMFYNRRPLDIRYGIDDHTRNMYWNGYCRMGVGFTNWKHIGLFVNASSAVTGATALT